MSEDETGEDAVRYRESEDSSGETNQDNYERRKNRTYETEMDFQIHKPKSTIYNTLQHNIDKRNKKAKEERDKEAKKEEEDSESDSDSTEEDNNDPNDPFKTNITFSKCLKDDTEIEKKKRKKERKEKKREEKKEKKKKEKKEQQEKEKK